MAEKEKNKKEFEEWHEQTRAAEAEKTSKVINYFINFITYHVIRNIQVKANLQLEEFRLKFCRESVTLRRF